MYKRDITRIISERLKEKRHFIQVLVGPRQVGKTTAIQQVLDGTNMPHHYAAADLPAPPLTDWISQQWNLARIKQENTKGTILVLDEVQKVPDWSVEVKRLWDEDTRSGKNLHVVLLGSSSLLIQKGLSESLAGRFELMRVSHWSFKECRDCFGWPLDKFMYFGGYPGAAVLVDDEKRWAQYIRDSLIETVISKDILLLNRVDKPALLRQLFVLACEYAGQILSYQKMVGQLADAGNTTTLVHYQLLLESAFLIRGLKKWSGGALRRRNSSPKWLPLNTALITALANRSFQEWRSNPDLWGRLVETAVGAHLINEACRLNFEVYYWREENHEVDFVVATARNVTAIEVKSGKRRAALPGMEKFRAIYKNAKVLTLGSQGVEIERFLETPLDQWI